jgi:aldose 1-epimerase
MMDPTARRLVAVMVVLVCGFGVAAVRADPIEERLFGQTEEGWPVEQYILTNKNGASVRIINYGAIVTNLFVPGRNGNMDDVVLGFDDVKQYQESGPAVGCIPGRYANRIANGTFTIDGNTYFVTLNSGMNTLHGGFKGLAKRMWDADTGVAADGPTVRLKIVDPDGEEGFPGTLSVTVLYTLTNDNTLKVQYYATTTKPTPINLTHHSYFNLHGNGRGDVLGYVAKIFASHYLPVTDEEIPTGQIAAVAGTPFDFTKAKPIGADVKSLPPPFTGYDHTMVLDNPDAKLKEAAEVYDPDSGRLLDCWTTEPAVHFFIGNNLGGLVGKDGATYFAHEAFCLECQHYPDSPNEPTFPNTILRPGHVYRQVTEFRFTVPTNPLKVGQ